MTDFQVGDLRKIQEKNINCNYLGNYCPDIFWKEMGRDYLNTFTADPEEKSPKRSIYLNIKPLLSRIYNMQPKSVLEVGCGFGRCMVFIKENLKSIDRLIGLEFSQTMIESSKRYTESCSLDYAVDIVQGKAQEIPFKDKEFDLIYTHVCLTHIPPKDIPKVTSEISRVAKDWIIHIERFCYPYEHPHQHRWSHLLAPLYIDLGWEVWENTILNKEFYTNILVLKRAVK